MRALAILFSLGLLCCKPVLASDLTKETAHEYLTLLGVEENLEGTFEVMLKALLDGTLRGVAKGVTQQGLSQEQAEAAMAAMRPHVVSASDELLANIDVLMPIEELEAKVYLPVLRESFSDEELSEVNRFLKTPVGRRYAQESGSIFQKSARLSQSIFGPRIEEFFGKAMAERRDQAIADVQAALAL